MNKNGRELEQVVHTVQTLRTGTVGRRGFGAENGMVWYGMWGIRKFKTVIGTQLYFSSVRQRYKHGGHVERER